MPKQSRRKAAKAKIRVVQKEAEAKVEAEEAERQRLEEERLEEERKRKQVISYSDCALLNHGTYVGDTKMEALEIEVLAERADEVMQFVEDGVGAVFDPFLVWEQTKQFGLQPTAAFDEVTMAGPFLAAASIAIASNSCNLLEQSLLALCKTIAADTLEEMKGRLSMKSIGFLLRAAETFHLESLLRQVRCEGDKKPLCAENAWALYQAILTSHPAIVATYNCYRKSLVGDIVQTRLDKSDASVESELDRRCLDSALNFLSYALIRIGGCLLPIILASDETQETDLVLHDGIIGDLVLLGSDGPRPDGLTCTNTNPRKCAVCNSAPIHVGGCLDIKGMNYCCGTVVCSNCFLQYDTSVSESIICICKVCGQVCTSESRFTILQYNADKGRPWAQYASGLVLMFSEQNGPPEQDVSFKAQTLLEESAAQGNYNAMMFLSEVLSVGEMVPIDRRKALGLALHALQIEPDLLFDRACAVACSVAMSTSRLLVRVNEGIDILTIFLKGGSGDANREFAGMFYAIGSPTIAFRFLERALICDIANDQRDEYVCDTATFVMKSYIHDVCDTATFVMKSYIHEGRIPMLQIFYTPLSKLNAMGWIIDDETEPLDELLLLVRDALISARHSCANCGVTLDARDRKMCKNCRASCYCSRQCQKMHWNRADGHSHKHDCKLVSIKRSLTLTEKDAIKGREDLNVRETIEYLKDLNLIT